MKYLLSLLLICLLSCSENEIHKKLKGIDAITIHFYYNNRPDSVIRIVKTNSNDAIQKIISFIDSKYTDTLPCANNGDIQFLKGDQLVETVNFNTLENQCRRFTFYIDNKLISTKASYEAVDFLKAIGTGKTNY